MAADPTSIPLVILIAPNVSYQMGGEAIMALQIYQALAARGIRVHQITHSRVRDEIARKHPEMAVSFVEDDRIDILCWRSKLLRPVIGLRFMKRAARLAQAMADENPGAVVHFTSPVSPILPLPVVRRAGVVVGPLDGNIHHPPAFRSREGTGDRLRRVLLRPVQTLHRLLFRGKQRADVLLVSGGERTVESLRLAGCRSEQMHESLCSGIPDDLRDRPLIEHQGSNFRFVHNGRLVPHKGTDLAIRAVGRTTNPVHLDIVGRGPTLDRLQALVAELKLGDRVHFVDWFRDHEEMYRAIREYRGFIFPSLAEAYGIVVAEDLMLGLPVVCAAWGGPGRLVSSATGIAIPPTSEEALITGLAAAMDRLSVDPDLANQYARAGRQDALDRGFSWSDMIDQWVTIYQDLVPRGRSAHPTPVPAGDAA